MKMSKRVPFLLAAGIALNSVSCSVIQELSQAVTSLSRCTFKLHGLSDFRLAGVSLDGRAKLGVLEAAQAAAAYAKGELPASFTLNVAVMNPNAGTTTAPRTVATLTSLAWTLRIDDVPTISGNIADAITIPAGSQQTLIPLRMNLDLLKFFRERGYEKVVNLALALGGAQGSTSRVTLRARPTVRTGFGPLTYPGEIDIVDREFRGE